MIKKKYFAQLSNQIKKSVQEKNWQVFIFGSSLSENHFGDIDVGILGNIKNNDLSQLKEDFEKSTFPYNVDFVDFNKTSEKFKKNVFDQKILWIKH